MTLHHLHDLAVDFTQNSPSNHLREETALEPELAGIKLCDPPIIGVASAGDDYLRSLQNNAQARLNQAPASFWLESARSVISLFFPFTRQVCESNRVDMRRPSTAFVHARNEGHAFINQVCDQIRAALEECGYAVAIPAIDPRFWAAKETPVNGQTFSSNWSERHVAYACGLGTFSLHKGIITRLGTAGRLASIITDLELPPTPRPYTELDEYCSRCGACAKNCPVGAITLEGGKDHIPCRAFLAEIEDVQAYKARKYIAGCGKCQINVPCERQIPPRRNRP